MGGCKVIGDNFEGDLNLVHSPKQLLHAPTKILSPAAHSGNPASHVKCCCDAHLTKLLLGGLHQRFQNLAIIKICHPTPTPPLPIPFLARWCFYGEKKMHKSTPATSSHSLEWIITFRRWDMWKVASSRSSELFQKCPEVVPHATGNVGQLWLGQLLLLGQVIRQGCDLAFLETVSSQSLLWTFGRECFLRCVD